MSASSISTQGSDGDDEEFIGGVQFQLGKAQHRSHGLLRHHAYPPLPAPCIAGSATPSPSLGPRTGRDPDVDRGRVFKLEPHPGSPLMTTGPQGANGKAAEGAGTAAALAAATQEVAQLKKESVEYKDEIVRLNNLVEQLQADSSHGLSSNKEREALEAQLKKKEELIQSLEDDKARLERKVRQLNEEMRESAQQGVSSDHATDVLKKQLGERPLRALVDAHAFEPSKRPSYPPISCFAWPQRKLNHLYSMSEIKPAAFRSPLMSWRLKQQN